MYQTGIEFTEQPPQVEVRALPSGRAEVVFWHNARQLPGEDEAERWQADCVSMTTTNRPGLLERVLADVNEWLAAAIEQSDAEEAQAQNEALMTPGQIRELREQNELYADLIQEMAMIIYA